MRPATGSIPTPRNGRGPICGFPVSTGRSDPGCCCCRAGGRRRSPPRVAGDISRLPLDTRAVLRRRVCHARRGLHLERHHRSRSRCQGRADAVAADPGRTGRACGRRWSFLVAQALVGLAVLLQFNRFAIGTGIASLVIVAIYPFMKRITWWPQIVLGLAFSWGALMGFAVIARADRRCLRFCSMPARSPG